MIMVSVCKKSLVGNIEQRALSERYRCEPRGSNPYETHINKKACLFIGRLFYLYGVPKCPARLIHEPRPFGTRLRRSKIAPGDFVEPEGSHSPMENAQ